MISSSQQKTRDSEVDVDDSNNAQQSCSGSKSKKSEVDVGDSRLCSGRKSRKDDSAMDDSSDVHEIRQATERGRRQMGGYSHSEEVRLFIVKIC